MYSGFELNFLCSLGKRPPSTEPSLLLLLLLFSLLLLFCWFYFCLFVSLFVCFLDRVILGSPGEPELFSKLCGTNNVPASILESWSYGHVLALCLFQSVPTHCLLFPRPGRGKACMGPPVPINLLSFWTSYLRSASVMCRPKEWKRQWGLERPANVSFLVSRTGASSEVKTQGSQRGPCPQTSSGHLNVSMHRD